MQTVAYAQAGSLWKLSTRHLPSRSLYPLPPRHLICALMCVAACNGTQGANANRGGGPHGRGLGRGLGPLMLGPMRQVAPGPRRGPRPRQDRFASSHGSCMDGTLCCPFSVSSPLLLLAVACIYCNQYAQAPTPGIRSLATSLLYVRESVSARVHLCPREILLNYYKHKATPIGILFDLRAGLLHSMHTYQALRCTEMH